MFIVLEIRPLEHYMRPARGLRAVGHRWMDECDSTLDSQRGTAYGSIAPRAALIATFPALAPSQRFPAYTGNSSPEPPFSPARVVPATVYVFASDHCDALPTAALQNESTRG